MAQGYDKYELDNQTGQSFRFALNDILEAAATQNSGDNSPNTANTSYPYQVWVDTTNDIVKIRDAATAGSWYSLYSVDADGKPTGAVAYGNYTIATNDTAGTGGTTAITVDTSQNVGIGLTSPSTVLDVDYSHTNTSISSPANAALRLQNTNAAANNYFTALAFTTSTTSVGSDSMIVSFSESAGNSALGFYTDTSNGMSEKVRIDSSGVLNITTTATNGKITLGHANTYLYGDTSNNFIIGTNGSDSVTVDSSGNVGVNLNPSGSAKLQVNGSFRLAGSGSASDSASPLLYRISGQDTLAISTSSTERMRITSSGFAKHTSTGTYGSATANYHEFNTGASNSAICQFFHRSTINPYGLIIKFTDAAPDNNSVYFINCVDSTSTVRFKVHSDGDCDNHDNSYGGTSDEKLKQDIVDATSQWDDIKDLRIRKFKFKSDVEAYGDEARTLLGVVAQEAETVSPGLIKNNPDLDDEGNDLGTVTKSVRYSVLYMKAVKALQEAMERIETLEAKVAALESA